MKITLDEKQCLKNKLTLQEALIAIAVSMGNYRDTINNMISRGIIRQDCPTLTDRWWKPVKELIGA